MIETLSVIVPMYRDWVGANKLARALGEQKLPTDVQLEIVIVDDGSGEPAPEVLTSTSHVRLLRLPQNVGRSAARNEGSQASTGQYLVFIDCDCLPLNDRFLQTHLQALRNGAVASTSHVKGVGGGFWDRYQQLASLRRQRQHEDSHFWSGSSQNLAVRRTAFAQINGFDLRYRQYGFEDRDFLLRLAALGDIVWSDGAQVSHNDSLHLDAVVKKMIEGAQTSAKIFSRDHPQAYRTLGYAAIDARCHPWLRPPARLVAPFIVPAARALDGGLASLPFWLASVLVKAMTALAFLCGSAQEDKQKPSSTAMP